MFSNTQLLPEIGSIKNMGGNSVVSDYTKYRGKCRQMSEELVKQDKSLRLVRGYYLCPAWGEQPHWWCVREDGTIVDPTRKQFPSKGGGTYHEFDGRHACEYCGELVTEEDGHFNGHHIYCSGDCAYKDVMG